MRLSGCFSQKNANAKRLKMMFPKQQKTFLSCGLSGAKSQRHAQLQELLTGQQWKSYSQVIFTMVSEDHRSNTHSFHSLSSSHILLLLLFAGKRET